MSVQSAVVPRHMSEDKSEAEEGPLVRSERDIEDEFDFGDSSGQSIASQQKPVVSKPVIQAVQTQRKSEFEKIVQDLRRVVSYLVMVLVILEFYPHRNIIKALRFAVILWLKAVPFQI